jgi:hypothetical protein
MRALRDPRGDCPKPAVIFRRRVRPHDAADVLLAVESVVVVVRLLAARAGFEGAFQNKHGSNRQPVMSYFPPCCPAEFCIRQSGPRAWL